MFFPGTETTATFFANPDSELFLSVMSDANWANETRPLLCHDPPEPLESLSDRTPSDLEAIAVPSEAQTPLPKVQLALLCVLRTLDPMCYFQIFPYINQFVSDLHVTEDPSKVGFYSGLVVSRSLDSL